PDAASDYKLPSFPAMLMRHHLKVDGGGNEGKWDTTAPIGTDLNSGTNDNGILWIGGGSGATYTVDGWINDAPSGGTSKRGKFATGPGVALTFDHDTSGINVNVGASLYIGVDSNLSSDGSGSTVTQNYDITINNGANISVSNNAAWDVPSTHNINKQSGVTEGTFGKYGNFT